MRVLSVVVIPQASRTDVVQTAENSFKVYVTQPSLKGKANKAMLKELSRYLGIRASQLIISKGDRTNEKTIILTEE